jgi:hypothetical protein
MQIREELRQKGHEKSRKTIPMLQEGQKYNFQIKGKNIVFRPKYRPLSK